MKINGLVPGHKHDVADYIAAAEFNDMDLEIAQYEEKIVKCRKEHKCLCEMGCERTINIGEYAYCFRGFTHDGEIVGFYLSLDCLDKYIEEHEDEEEEE